VVIEPDRAEAAVLGLDVMNRSRRPIVATRVLESMRRRLSDGDLSSGFEWLASV
jgi:hypothetical protein